MKAIPTILKNKIQNLSKGVLFPVVAVSLLALASLAGTSHAAAAIALDKNLGTNTPTSDTGGSSSVLLRTSNAAAPNSKIIVVTSIYHGSTCTLGNVAGGELAWHVDVVGNIGNGNEAIAVASADAPSGLTLGTTITANFKTTVGGSTNCSSAPGSRYIAGSSFTGLATGTTYDGTRASTTGGGNNWTSTAINTANANDLIFGFGMGDGITRWTGYTAPNGVCTASTNYTDLHCKGELGSDGNGWEDQFRIVSATGSYAAGGAFTGANTWQNLGVAVAFKAASNTSDTSAPTPPANLVASNLSETGATLSWSPSNDNVGVTGYTLYKNSVNAGTTTSTTTNFSNLTCNTSYNLGVDAYDAAGNHSTVATLAVTTNPCDTTAPIVSLTAPSDGSKVTGPVTVSADASDNRGVVGVQFKLDGNNLGTEDTSSPYSITWDSTTATNDTHSLTAVARDSAGNTATSSTVSVAVNNVPPPDIMTPTVSMTAPANNSTVKGTTVNVSANASDNVGVANVQFMLDGVALGSADTTSPYSVTWDTTTTTDGSHTLSAIASDAAGNSTTSSSVTVTVDNTSPTVDISSPTDSSTVSGSTAVNANASDNIGVVGVQFKLDGNNLGSEDTTAPYSVNWTTGSVANGPHILTAVARDAAGNTTISTAVNVTVSNTSTAPLPMPMISRSKPAFASSSVYPASSANDSDYSSHWTPSSTPGWLAYDLSSVPAAQRGQVLLAWYNDPITTPYDYPVISDVPYNLPNNYTIDVNAAAGGTSAPTTGWVTLATVTGNVYHSRQHLLNMTGYNWIRINITTTRSGQPTFNMDVYDAHNGATDSWIIYGDSITQDGLPHEPVDFSSGSNVSQLVNVGNPNYFPAFEDGGIGGLWSSDGAANINRWLSAFPGHYVGLAYGTNDANECSSPTTFYNNYATMVNAVIAAGKIPVIPTIPASKTTNIKNCGPGFNAQIQNIYNNYPQVVKGPDLWAFFTANPTLIGSDNLHPSMAGYAQMRQQWANAMLANVYNK